MKRTLEREWLDDLPPQDQTALGSRRDLHRLNRLMGHADLLLQMLRSSSCVPTRIVELGAGDGTLLLRLARELCGSWKNVEVVLVDQQSVIADETLHGFKALGWQTQIVIADVFAWLEHSQSNPADMMIANLFLHHFSDVQLRTLFESAARKTRLFAACEPRRARMPLVASQLVGAIGCNAVTRHDAVLSVRAGFADEELSALWPQNASWRLRERSAQLFTHTFLAQKIGG